MAEKINKKGQVAIFVIIAVVIIVLILGLFFLQRKSATTPSLSGEQNLQSAIQKCVRDAVNQVADIMIPQGGFISPENYKEYKFTKIAYLCQNIGYFKPCINQHPLILTEITKEIKDYIHPKIEQCYQDIESGLQSKQYSVNMGAMNLNVSLGSNTVDVDINRDFVLKKNGETTRFKEIKIQVSNPIYDLTRVANSIVNEEAKYCYFEYVGYMLLNRRFDISKFTMSDSTRIYTIKDLYSNKEMNIAIRGCVIPPGP